VTYDSSASYFIAPRTSKL